MLGEMIFISGYQNLTMVREKSKPGKLTLVLFERMIVNTALIDMIISI